MRTDINYIWLSGISWLSDTAIKIDRQTVVARSDKLHSSLTFYFLYFISFPICPHKNFLPRQFHPTRTDVDPHFINHARNQNAYNLNDIKCSPWTQITKRPSQNDLGYEEAAHWFSSAAGDAAIAILYIVKCIITAFLQEAAYFLLYSMFSSQLHFDRLRWVLVILQGCKNRPISFPGWMS